jgi:hypothetical protein
MVWLRLSSGCDTSARSIVWDFLARGCFAAKTPDHKGFISLDFLGFSRPNRDFSMGYAAFRRKKISRALLPLGRRRRDRSGYSYDAEMQYGSSSKPNSFSAFLRSIAVDRNCRFFVESPTGRFRGLSVIISDTTLNSQFGGKSLNWVLSKVSL